MRILTINNGDSYIHGISQVAVFAGHKTIIWNGKREFHRVCQEFKPDMVISNYIDDNILLYLSKHPEIQSGFKVSNEDYEKVTSKVFNTIQINGQVAANIFSGHYPFTKEKKFVVCANLPKNQTTEKLLGGFLDHKAEIPLKLFSNDNWPGEYYCGPISEQNFSMIANLSYFTIHSGEVDQSLMNAALSHSLVITDNPNVPIVPVATSYEEIVGTIIRLNSNIKEYELLMNNMYDYIFKNHTYFHRFDSLMNQFGFESNIVDRMKELK